jgi:hypothetical protein
MLVRFGIVVDVLSRPGWQGRRSQSFGSARVTGELSTPTPILLTWFIRISCPLFMKLAQLMQSMTLGNALLHHTAHGPNAHTLGTIA